MFRRVWDLRPGDTVRPYGDDGLWSVTELRRDGTEGRCTLVVGHPVHGFAEIEVSLDDMVKLG